MTQRPRFNYALPPRENPVSASNPPKSGFLRSMARRTALAVLVIASLALIGWMAGIPLLITLVPGWVAMKVNTALLLILCAGSLLALTPAGNPGRIRCLLIYAAMGIVVSVASMTELEYLTKFNFYIDNGVFNDQSQHTPGYHPGRMSPISAADFIFLGSALAALAARRNSRLVQLLAGSAGFLSLVVLTGTSYGLEELIGKLHYTAVALHTNICFILLFTGIFCATGEEGVMELITDSGSAGKVLRRLLPTAVFVPLAISSIGAIFERLGYMGMELGVSIFSISTIVAFTALVWSSALFLRRSEDENRLNESRLRESLRRYSFLAEAMPEIIWTTTADGTADYFNSRWFNYTGLDMAQSIGNGWASVLHPDDLAKCIDTWQKSVRTGWDYEVEYRLHRASDDTYRWHTSRAIPLRDDEGKILQWVGTCIDIDDQKRARAELESRVAERTSELAGARESLQSVLDAATQVAIIAGNPEGVITVFNRGAEKMLGYTAEEMVGKHTPELIHLGSEVLARSEELSKELGRQIEGFDTFIAYASTGRHEEREWTYIRKDGTRLTVSLIVTASYNRIGEIVGYLGIATDVTARRFAEKTLRDQALILDLANDTIFIRDMQDRITYWNQGAERLYGWRKEEALGKVTHSLFKTQFPKPLVDIQGEILSEGYWEGELVHTNRMGLFLTVASSWTLQRDANGRPASVIVLNHDITDRKRAEQEVKTSRERLNAILNGSLDGVIVYDAVRDAAGKIEDFRFTMINPAAEKMMRENAASVLGTRIKEKFPNVIADGLFEKFVRIVDEGKTLDFEYLSSRSDPPRWYRIAGVKLGDGLAISYTEISARKKQEEQLQEAKSHAESADRAKSDFLANMSHEIRTPMNGVIGLAGLLLDTEMNPEQRNLSETIRSSAESLLTVINDILDFSKIEAGKLSFEQIDFDLRKVVEDALELLAGQAQAKNIELVGGIETGTTTRLRGDPGRVSQVLTNLVSNALKFTSAGEVVLRVADASAEDGRVVIRFTVTDTGLGISPEVQARLFQPFVQADTSTSRQYGGTGLGLAICKKLAESMNGQIGVESEPGRGSTFWVTLEFARRPESAIEPPPPEDFINARVLVVDDNETSRQFLHRQIVAWRLENGCASSGDEALALLHEAASRGKPYALALVDLHMPGTDGLTLSQEISSDPRLHGTRVVLLTPLGKPVPSGKAAPVSIAGCCVKPIRQSALFDCLVQALARPAGKGPRRSGPLPKPASSLPERKERILLAEDNLVNQEVAVGNLLKLGYRPEIASNGLEVLDAIEAKNFDIILMDCQMPELDGYETTRQIRLRERNGRRTRIIAMTANAMVGDREKCLAAGMDDYVGKPLRRAELRAALGRATSRPGKPFVEAVLRGMCEDGPEEMARLIGIFTDSSPASIAGMQAGLAKKDAKALAFAAHTLKGSCSNLGATPLREICARIETAGLEGSTEGCNELVDSAGKELQRLLEALAAHVREKITS